MSDAIDKVSHKWMSFLVPRYLVIDLVQELFDIYETFTVSIVV